MLLLPASPALAVFLDQPTRPDPGARPLPCHFTWIRGGRVPGGSGERAGRAAGAPASRGCHLGGYACLGGGSLRPAGSPPGTHPDCHNQSLSEQIMCLIYYTCPPDPASEFILIYGAPSRASLSLHPSQAAAGLPSLPCLRCLFASFPPSVRPFQTALAPSFVTFPRGHPLADFIIHFLTATSFASFPIQSPPIHGRTPYPRPSAPPRDLPPPIRNVRRGECRLNTHKWTQRGASGTPVVSPMNISRVLKLVCLYIDFISLCCCGADLRVKRGRHRRRCRGGV